ncbi:DUF4189 domain-containing protein [Lysobacter enzymogenes]|nr:DUF4189 domain-containing protein [Lysobacter enzymogenes]QCW25630.1 DUF4189 domain-containing protein [Lysobacter enzymogenes]
MRIQSITLLLTTLLLPHAALSCPQGTVPQQGIGWQGCAPVPGTAPTSSSHVKAREIWEDRWGAIALNHSNISAGFGSSSGLRRKKQAESAALKDCRSKGIEQCQVRFTYYSQCAVIVWGDRTSNITGAPSIEHAREIGMKKCEQTQDTNCEVLFSQCSYPERIQ